MSQNDTKKEQNVRMIKRKECFIKRTTECQNQRKIDRTDKKIRQYNIKNNRQYNRNNKKNVYLE